MAPLCVSLGNMRTQSPGIQRRLNFAHKEMLIPPASFLQLPGCSFSGKHFCFWPPKHLPTLNSPKFHSIQFGRCFQELIGYEGSFPNSLQVQTIFQISSTWKTLNSASPVAGASGQPQTHRCRQTLP